MRITSTHARFWQSKQPAPAWVKAAVLPKLPVPAVSIHACINAHALPRRVSQGELEVGNTLSILRYARNRGDSITQHLYYLAASVHSSARRRSFCVRWLKRIHDGQRGDS